MSLRRASLAWSFSGISFTKDWGNSSRLSSAAATTVANAAPTTAATAPTTPTTPTVPSTPLKPVYVTVRQARALLPSGVQASKEAVQAVNTFLDELAVRFCGEIPAPVTRASIRATAEHMFLPGTLQEACVRVCTLRPGDTARREHGASRKLDAIERMFGCWLPYTGRAASRKLRANHSTFSAALSDNDLRYGTPAMTRHAQGSGSFSSSVAVQQHHFQRQPSSGRDPQSSMEDLATCVEEEEETVPEEEMPAVAMLNGIELCDLFRNRATKTLSFRRSGTVRDVSGARMLKERRRAYAEYVMLLGGIIREVARHLAIELGLHAQRCERRMVSVRDLLALLDTDPQLESIFRHMQLRDDLRMALYPDAAHGRIIRSIPSFVILKPGRREDEAQDIRTQVRRSFMDTEDEDDQFGYALRQRRHSMHAAPRAPSRRSMHSIASDTTELEPLPLPLPLQQQQQQYNYVSYTNNPSLHASSPPPLSPPSPRSYASRRFHAQRQTNSQLAQTAVHGCAPNAHGSIVTQPLLRYYGPAAAAAATAAAAANATTNATSINWPAMTLEEPEIDEADADVPLLPMDVLPSPAMPLEPRPSSSAHSRV